MISKNRPHHNNHKPDRRQGEVEQGEGKPAEEKDSDHRHQKLAGPTVSDITHYHDTYGFRYNTL